MRVTFLGTGTSHGVPMIGCRCRTCRSTDPRDRRTRCSVLLELDSGTVVLIDTSPDLRAQALAAGIERVDAILYTHSHADHILGLDETRRFNVLQGTTMPVFGSAGTIADIRRVFSYAFDGRVRHGGGVPDLATFTIAGPFCLGGVEIQPVPIFHGTQPILGYRIGRFAYLTDCSGIPDSSRPLLRDLETLVLGALRQRPHPTHFSLEQACDAARAIGARRTWFTHMCHDVKHDEVSGALPPGIDLAYDGLVLETGG